VRILLIKAMAEGHAYSRFVDALDASLRVLGHGAVVSQQAANVRDGVASNQQLVGELQSGRYDAVLSFSSFFGSIRLQDGRSLFDALGVKFAGWQLDHPIYAPQSLTPTLQQRFAVYSNPNHLRYAEAVGLPGRGTTLLPGGELPAAAPREHSGRSRSILIAATYRGEPVRLWEQLADSPGKRLLAGVVDHLLADPQASLLDAFDATSAQLRLGARLGQDPAFDAQMMGFLREPLTYVRNHDRIRIVSALVEAGLPVAICGAGWRDLFGERRNVAYLDPVDFKDLPALYGDARVVINLNAGNGASERAVHAALAGAAVVSDYSPQLAELFGGEEGVVFFDRARPQTVAEAAAGLLDGRRGEDLARRGFARIAAQGLWRHRAAQLAGFLEQA
jgi:hypothetical protein